MCASLCLPACLQSKACASDPGPIDPACPCLVCRRYSRSYLSRVLKSGSLGPQLVTYHNLAYMLGLMRDMRQVGRCCDGRAPRKQLVSLPAC